LKIRISYTPRSKRGREENWGRILKDAETPNVKKEKQPKGVSLEWGLEVR